MDSWEVVDGLVKMHAYEGLGSDGMVGPAEVPVGFFRLVDDIESYFVGYFSNDGVVGDCVSE